MRANPIRAAIERGEAQIGTWVNLIRSPAVLPLLKAAGLDFARVDMEHSSPSIETIADMAVLARALDFPIAVRPPVANREWITRLLDVGVLNLHCPQVESAEHAAEIVVWGLIDRPVRSVFNPDTTCAALRAGYEVLVGEPPLHGFTDRC